MDAFGAAFERVFALTKFLPISAKTESIFLPLFSCFTISYGSEKFRDFARVLATVHVILIRQQQFDRPAQVEDCPKKAIDSVLQISVTTFRNLVIDEISEGCQRYSAKQYRSLFSAMADLCRSLETFYSY